MAQASLLTFFGGPGGGQPTAMSSRNSGGTGPAGHAPLGPELAALLQRVEGTGDLLGIVMRQLADAEGKGDDLGRAGSVCRVWRGSRLRFHAAFTVFSFVSIMLVNAETVRP